MYKKIKGFTLIELMVVISIVGLLSTLVLIGVRTARARAQDTQRKSNTKAINRALDSYAMDNSEKYPISNDDGSGNGSCPEFLTSTSPTGSILVSQDYISTIPTDPNMTGVDQYYKYCHLADSDEYFVQKQLASDPPIYHFPGPDQTPSTISKTEALIVFDSQKPFWPYQLPSSLTAMVETKTPTALQNVTVAWTPASDNMGSRSLTYELSYKLSSASQWTTISIDTTYKTFTTLNNASYDFKVVPVDSSGLKGDTLPPLTNGKDYKTIDFTNLGPAPSWIAGSPTASASKINVAEISFSPNANTSSYLLAITKGANTIYRARDIHKHGPTVDSWIALPAGTYSVKIYLTDNYGNYTASPTVSVTLTGSSDYPTKNLLGPDYPHKKTPWFGDPLFFDANPNIKAAKLPNGDYFVSWDSWGDDGRVGIDGNYSIRILYQDVHYNQTIITQKSTTTPNTIVSASAAAPYIGKNLGYMIDYFDYNYEEPPAQHPDSIGFGSWAVIFPE